MHPEAYRELVCAACHFIRARQLLYPTKIGDTDISAVSQAVFDAFQGKIEPNIVLNLVLDAWDQVYPQHSLKKKVSPATEVENTTSGRTMSRQETCH